MHIISADDFSPEIINIVFDYTTQIKAIPERWMDGLKGKILANIFYEESTRTRLSFETAMCKLGGRVLTYFPEKSSQKKGESNQDTIRTISQYVDTMVIRHPDEGFFSECRSYSEVPIISAGNGSDEHPTQALLDLYTIKQFKGNNNPLTIMFTGDLTFSRTIHSFIKILKYSDLNVKLIYTQLLHENQIIPNLYRSFIDSHENYEVVGEKEIPKLLPKVDVLYMTRKQIERWRDFPPFFMPSQFKLTQELLDTMKSDAIIMHPLPRNAELPKEIDNDPRAIYFHQAKLGLYVRMALLWHLLASGK